MIQHKNKQLLAGMVLLSFSGGCCPVHAQAQQASLNWLQGSWCMASENQWVEEVWLADVGGNLIGMSRTVADGQVESFEFMRIVSKDGVTQFIAQPGGGAATSFTATTISDRQLVVRNSEHDFPQQIEYSREADALTARISGSGEEGNEMAFSFDYRLCKP